MSVRLCVSVWVGVCAFTWLCARKCSGNGARIQRRVPGHASVRVCVHVCVCTRVCVLCVPNENRHPLRTCEIKPFVLPLFYPRRC